MVEVKFHDIVVCPERSKCESFKMNLTWMGGLAAKDRFEYLKRGGFGSILEYGLGKPF